MEGALDNLFEIENLSSEIVALQQDVPAPEDVHRREDNGGKKRVSDPTRAKAGEIDHAVRQPIGGIDEIDEERPAGAA